jgi:hypothetical protein
MTRELIEMVKLIDYKFDEKHRTNPFTLDAYIEGWKHCKSEMLEIIESYKPKWIESPDKKGFWWFLSPDETVSCATIIEVGVELYREERDTHIYHISSYIGKWQKAIMPE